jgi:hypothetical protein
LAESRIFARRETHVTSEDELAAAAAHAASDLCDTDYRGLGDTDERIHQNREAGRPDGRGDVSRLAGQIKVSEIEIGNRALEHDDAQALTGVHPNKQILQAVKDRRVQDVERRIVEYDFPVPRRFLDYPHRRRWIGFSHGSPPEALIADIVRGERSGREVPIQLGHGDMPLFCRSILDRIAGEIRFSARQVRVQRCHDLRTFADRRRDPLY